MLRVTSWKTLVAAAGLLAASLSIVACGGGSSSSSSNATGESEASGKTDVAAAKATIMPYVGHPSPFPVTENLKEVPKGAEIAYINCGTPVCALFGTLTQAAAETMGIKWSQVKSGTSANTVSAAFDSVLAQSPDAVLVPGLEPSLIGSKVEELEAANIPVISTGIAISDGELGINSPQQGKVQSELDGQLLAAYVVAESKGTNIVYYNIPEYSFSGVVEEAFNAELEKICPECSVRSVDISAATVGNTAPNTIVSDLQANPETEVAVFASDEAEIGLPAALESAGIEIETIGNAPTPTNLQYIKEGKETAGLGIDIAVLAWTIVDQAAREIVGQELSGLEKEALTVVQLLGREDINFNPSKGWTGYPDFAERFAKLWGVAG